MNEELEYKLALAYGGLAAIAWLGVAVVRLVDWRRHVLAAETVVGQLREDILHFGGTLLVDGVWSLAAMAVFAFVVFQLVRATWSSWDIATATLGGAAVLSLVLVCAQRRVIALAPWTLLPYWLLIYRPGVKRACGVGGVAADVSMGNEAVLPQPSNGNGDGNELQALLATLHVFEQERGMDTDTFVTRYTQGLEDDSQDNEEWFAIARMARRSQERLSSTNGHRHR
ncbi:MAG: hypothetical protein NVS2B7_17650 [Herpetosiphon sp.]